MRRFLLAAISLLLPAGLAAQCSSNLVAGSTDYVIFMPPPDCYNGDFILFAHGYVPVGSPPGTWLSQLALPDGTSLPTLVNGLGFGFAAAGFSKDGLAVLQGISDTKALATLIQGSYPVHKFFFTGASEGGLMAVKALESDPTYGGALAVCGPIGSFRKQINYFGDVRVLFDYFFPGLLPGTAVSIPQSLMDNWASVYEPAVRNAVNSRPLATLQLVNTAKIPIGLSFANAADAITSVLWYNVFATTDLNATLDPSPGGNAFDNIGRYYTGSFNDARLNALVARYAATPAALTSLASYETSGVLNHPLVTLHNTADPVVPYWQETLYAAKAQAAGSAAELAQIPSLRYGHCNITAGDAKVSLLVLLLKAGL